MVALTLDGFLIGDPRPVAFKTGGAERIDVIIESQPEKSAPMRFELRFGGFIGEQARRLKKGDWIIATGRMAAIGSYAPQVVVFCSSFELMSEGESENTQVKEEVTQ